MPDVIAAPRDRFGELFELPHQGTIKGGRARLDRGGDGAILDQLVGVGEQRGHVLLPVGYEQEGSERDRVEPGPACRAVARSRPSHPGRPRLHSPATRGGPNVKPRSPKGTGTAETPTGTGQPSSRCPRHRTLEAPSSGVSLAPLPVFGAVPRAHVR